MNSTPGLAPIRSLCEVCRRWSVARLCAPCVERFAAPAHRCEHCATVLVGGAAQCGDCQRRPPSFAHTICALDYAFPWDRLITHFKFHAMVELAKPLSHLLLGAVLASTRARPELLIPVPLSDARLAERGFNQAWEVTRRLGPSLNIPAHPRGLMRVLDTPQQAQLTRAQRLANLRAAFVVPAAQQAQLRGRHLALIDDVLTTGATAEEATQALLRGGAASVALWVLARTPTERPQADDIRRPPPEGV